MQEHKIHPMDDRFSNVTAESQTVNNLIADEIAEIFLSCFGGSKSGMKFLEAGSGSGILSAKLAKSGFNVTLLDPSEKALSLSRDLFEREGLTGKFIKGNLFDMPFGDKEFDCVWNSGVIAHFTGGEQELAIREMARVSKKHIIVAVPNAKCFFYRVELFHQRSSAELNSSGEYPMHSLADLYKRTGVVLIREIYAGQSCSYSCLQSLIGSSDIHTAAVRISHFLSEPENRSEFISLMSYLLVGIGQTDIKAVSENGTMQHDQETINEISPGEAKLAISVLTKRNEELQQRIIGRNELERMYIDDIEKIKTSLSWRITSPLRHLFDVPLALIRALRNPEIKIPGIIKRSVIDKFSKIFNHSGRYGLTESLHRETLFDFFVFPIIDWDFRFQRPQQIATRLGKKGNRIFYFRTSFNRSRGTINSKDISIRKVGINIFEIGLASRRPVNIYKDDITGTTILDDLLESIEVVRKIFAISASISIIDHPFWWSVAKMISNTEIVYDCMDEHSGFSNNKDGTLKQEMELVRSAGLVISSSMELFNRNSENNSRSILVRNGTDFDHFSCLPNPGSLQNIRHPIIGYYGAIAEWFDITLLQKCALAYPEYEFVLTGNVTTVDIDKISALPNVHLTGEKSYSLLPGYLKEFDVCLIPFRINKLTASTNPVKFYEFLSAGKPVVTVALPELYDFRDICYYSNSTEEFTANIARAVNEDGASRARRVEIARANSWDERVESLHHKILDLFPRVSILIVTYNNLNYTEACLQSIFRYSRYPHFEVIIVDNHSTDGTVGYLKTFAEEHLNVVLILNDENKGFARANNQGLKMANGEYIVFLNNDTIVTNNWLINLVYHFRANGGLGLICPVTNDIANEAKINITIRPDDDIQQVAYFCTAKRGGMSREMGMVPLFCAMAKKEVLDKVGGLCEEYEIGLFEDDDLSRRIGLLGLQLHCAEDVFIFHIGRGSFKNLSDKDYRKIFCRNKAVFESKWGKWTPHSMRDSI